jgi:hypothetical protein
VSRRAAARWAAARGCGAGLPRRIALWAAEIEINSLTSA